MSGKSKLVNLDAMIPRADFAIEADTAQPEMIRDIAIRDLLPDSVVLPSLRKPDFQRETNHWSPEQVVSLLECFVNGDLIPSIILWRSPEYLFVIDGGHRLSVLRGWVLDDYGDGPLSEQFFGTNLPKEQRAVARATRNLVADRVGTWQHISARQQQPGLSAEERRKTTAVMTRALSIQVVLGNADKAERSFFKINTEGTPLDEIEQLLLTNRRRPIAIAARAIIRAGKGHRYWSAFPPSAAATIEEHAKNLHQILFEPELSRPIKTLDLPLGGSKGVRTALQVLIDFILIGVRNQQGIPRTVEGQEEDVDGAGTIATFERALRLAKRITGNDGGSLGLHPAVYFYGPSGVHSGPMFMGTVALIGEKLANNDSSFFKKFTSIREALEQELIANKDLIATILQKQSSRKRNLVYRNVFGALIDALQRGAAPREEWYIETAGLKGRMLTGGLAPTAVRFSETTKSTVFITRALEHSIKCPVCQGYLDVEKSVSYDHITRVRDGGLDDPANCQLTHPYCNQSMREA